MAKEKKYKILKWQELIHRNDEFLDIFSGKWKKTSFYNCGERVGFGEKYRRLTTLNKLNKED